MPIVVVAVPRGSSGRSERPGSRARDGVALDSPGRGRRGALDSRTRMLPLRRVPRRAGAAVICATKASTELPGGPPPKPVWKAPGVVGKLLEKVAPVA